MRAWTTDDFPVGFEQLHPDVSINFQLNRLHNFCNDPVMLQQLRDAAVRIRDFRTLIDELVPLAERAEEEGELLRAAMYYRGAEFVAPVSDPRKGMWRRRFRELAISFYGIPDDAHSWVPFGDIELSAYRFAPKGPSRGTVVMMNGFDGYLEEFMRLFLVFREVGYEVIAFDGPGHGRGAGDLPGFR